MLRMRWIMLSRQREHGKSKNDIAKECKNVIMMKSVM